jgi:hypothetical protein
MRPRRKIAVALICATALYAVATMTLYAAMRQPPERFGAFMTHVPMAAMMILPFRPLWMSAREGNLQPGDAAPDFNLPTVDQLGRVKLSDEYRERPVVLVFGSYT